MTLVPGSKLLLSKRADAHVFRSNEMHHELHAEPEHREKNAGCWQCHLVPCVKGGHAACDRFLIWAIAAHESVNMTCAGCSREGTARPYSVLRGSLHDGPSSTTSVCSWGHVTVCPLGRVTSLGVQDALMGRLPGLHPVPRSTPQQQGPASSSFSLP